MSTSTRFGGNAPGLTGGLPCPALLPPLDLAAAARARHHRRALENAAEHAAALLQALGLPRLVTPDFQPIDPAEVGTALDAVIAALDEADAPVEDLEDEGHDEPSLGWIAGVAQGFLARGGTSDLELDTADWEHTLGAPERHPFVLSMTAAHFEPANGQGVRRYRRDMSQAAWAQGERREGEGEAEPGYDLPEGDDERCASDDVEREPSIGWPEDFTAVLDPARQPEADAGREADPSATPEPWTAQRLAERARGRRVGAELRDRAEAIRHRGRPSLTGPASNIRLIGARVLNAITPHLSRRPA